MARPLKKKLFLQLFKAVSRKIFKTKNSTIPEKDGHFIHQPETKGKLVKLWITKPFSPGQKASQNVSVKIFEQQI